MTRTTSFAGIVDLIRKAEDALIGKAGQKDPKDRVSTLRGIYYGMAWSLDNRIERERSEVGAWIRNLGFQTYTGGNKPADPRPALGDSLFSDLQGSQSVHDGSRGIDIGHMLIGLETRSNLVMRNVQLPGQGGTGLEIVTWLGDLGGGTASLARRRVTVPTSPVENIFNNTTSDYGVMDNLEGDVAGYLVAAGNSPGGEPLFTSGKGVADMLTEYLPLSSNVQWAKRASRFSMALGANVSVNGIANTKTLIDKLTPKLYDFAVWYAATRWIPSGELMGKTALDSCKHLRGAAQEVATVFVSALSGAISKPGSLIRASSPYPSPMQSGPCDSDLMKAASTDVSVIRKQFDIWRKDLRKLFE